MSWYCEVHCYPEWMQVLKVYEGLLDVEVGARSYLALIIETIAVTCVEFHIYKVRMLEDKGM